MINNEFHLIGICTSDFERLAYKKFQIYTIRVEVEKYKGGVFDLECVVYSMNKSIDTSRPMLGKQVALSGFIDSFTNDDNSTRTRLVLQYIMELNRAPKVKQETQASAETAPIDVSDDDLPF